MSEREAGKGAKPKARGTDRFEVGKVKEKEKEKEAAERQQETKVPERRERPESGEGWPSEALKIGETRKGVRASREV
jgi:hypothetical protein